MKLSLKTMIAALLLLAAAAVAVTSLLPPPIEVETSTVIRGSLTVTVREDGRTRIREKYVVSAPVSGRLARIDLQEGDALTASESVLAVILPSEPELLDARAQAEAQARIDAAAAHVSRSEATVGQIQVQLDLAEAEFARAEELMQKNSISHADHDAARAAFHAAQQSLSAAGFDRRIAEFELEMNQAAARQFVDDPQASADPFTIHAPITGRVLRVFQKSSTVVSPATPLLEIGDPRNLEVEIDVLSTDAVRIQPGADVLIDHWGGAQPLHARVRVIEPAAFTQVSSLGVEEQRVNVIADFLDPQEQYTSLGDGYRVEGQITIERLDDVLLIPNSALFRHRHEWHVLTLRDGRAVLTPVTVGQQNESHAEITAGLQQGETVIVYPSDRIADGTRVQPVSVDQPDR
ncbi:MAG: efflux RND transporter periplasmic adaptor subunit [Planctomycetaceae bacterium]|nr:efflux RND transporter periplasmic adaptor subunit [Planctomycetaceae bacterium]